MKKLLAVLFMLGIAAIGVLFFYTNYANRPPLPQNNVVPTVTELEVCKEFLKIAQEVSCEDAVKIAEGKYDGIVQSINQGSQFRKKSDPNPEGKDVWRIDLLLNKPVSKNQQIVTKATIFLDRKTGEDLANSYL